jgi:hypothetical protein
MVGVVRGAILRLLTANPHPLGRGYSTLESVMNIELEEVVVMDVSDDALELAAGVAQGGRSVMAMSAVAGMRLGCF